MNRRHLWAIIARREMVTKLSEKSFIMSTIFTSVILIAGIVAMIFFGSRQSTTSVAVTDQAGAAIVSSLNASDDSWAPKQYASVNEASAAVKQGDVQLALVKADSGWQAIMKDADAATGSGITRLQSAVERFVTAENARTAGIDPQALSKGTTLQVTSIDGKQPEEQFVAYITGILFAVLFYMTAIMFGMQIAASVVKEKESRVVEILTAAVPTRQLLLGKILGNSALAFAQVLLYVGIALIGISFTSYAHLLPALATGTGWFIVFFVTGFLALSCLWVAAGAMATRYEDLQATANPLILLLVAAYFAAFAAKGAVQVALSYVPIISSILMPMRLIAGTAQWWEAVLALIANLAFMAAAIWVGAALYRRGVLHTGGTLKWRQAFSKAA